VMLAVQPLVNATKKTSAVTVTKRHNFAEQKKIAKAQHKLSAQRKSDQISGVLSPLLVQTILTSSKSVR